MYVRPVVNAFSPAPERTMTRTEGSWERWLNRGGSSSHIGWMKAFSFDGRLISTWAT